MTKEEVDALKTALLKAIVGAFDVIENGEPVKRVKRKTKSTEVEEDESPEELAYSGHCTPSLKKRGRPPKREVQKLLEKTIEVEETEEKVEDVLAFEAPMPSPEKKKNDYIAAAKRVGTGVAVRNVGNLQEVVTKGRKMKFIDDPSVKQIPSDQDIKVSERTRAPAQIGTFHCTVCGKDFQGSYKEFPQALYQTRDSALGVVDAPLIKCNECSTKPVNRY